MFWYPLVVGVAGFSPLQGIELFWCKNVMVMFLYPAYRAKSQSCFSKSRVCWQFWQFSMANYSGKRQIWQHARLLKKLGIYTNLLKVKDLTFLGAVRSSNNNKHFLTWIYNVLFFALCIHKLSISIIFGNWCAYMTQSRRYYGLTTTLNRYLANSLLSVSLSTGRGIDFFSFWRANPASNN